MKFKLIFRKTLIVILFSFPILGFTQEIASVFGILEENKISTVDFEKNNNFSEIGPKDFNTFQDSKPTPPWFVRRIKVTAGIFIPVNDTKIEVGNKDDTFGTTIDFENDLGFKKSTATFLGNIQWRISRRSKLDFSYFHLNRNSSYKLQKEIEFGENIYPVNADVYSYFKTNIYILTYGYAFFTNPKYELGLMIGAHTLRTNVGIGLSGTTANFGYSDEFDVTAPLPDLGIWGGYAFSDKFAFNGSATYLALKVENVSGKILSYNFSFMYKLMQDLDIAVSYTGLNFTVDVEKERLDGYLKWGYNGPSLSATYSFGDKNPFK